MASSKINNSRSYFFFKNLFIFNLHLFYQENKMKTSFMQFFDFFNKDLDGSTYLTDNETYQIYVRLSTKVWNGKKIRTFDLSNIHYIETGTGAFTKLLIKIEKVLEKSDRTLYIEEIQTERFMNYFEKKGYEIKVSSNQSWNAIKA
jgi:hypothetical protein